MTFWDTALRDGDGPAFRRLADAIHAAIADGQLARGERLPAQRDLAYRLGVSIGTVTRAYELAARRGDVTATIGKGTYVGASAPAKAEGPVNLRINLPADIGQGVDIAAALAKRPAAEFMGYIPFGGSDAVRRAGTDYLALGGMSADPGDLIVTAGGQHALLTALLASTEAGDLVLCEPFTFGGFLDAARLMNRRVLAVPADRDGILPDAFEKLCADQKPAACFLSPTAQNPTGATLATARRKAIAASLTRHKVMLIEDALYDPLEAAPPPPLTSFAPEQGFYVASLSKTVAPGFRVGFLVCPANARKTGLRDRANDIQHLLGMGPPWAMAEIAGELIANGAAKRLVSAQADEIAARRTLARAHFGEDQVPSHSNAPHLWLALPPPWTADGFALAAEEAGIIVSPSGHFAVGEATAHIRLSLGAAPDRAVLDTCLEKIATLMESRPAGRRRSI